jgi:hypothetical protein
MRKKLDARGRAAINKAFGNTIHLFFRHFLHRSCSTRFALAYSVGHRPRFVERLLRSCYVQVVGVHAFAIGDRFLPQPYKLEEQDR